MGDHIKKNMSYICARDPSLCFQYNHLKVRRNLVSRFDATSSSSSEQSENIEHYQVYLRIKGSKNNVDNLYNVKNIGTLICRVPDELQHIRNIHEGGSITRAFTFSKILDTNCSQSKVFDDIVKSKVLSFINGYKCTLLSYGASGSGKTFTIVGTADDPGIIPRSLEYLFRTLPSLPDTPTIKPKIGGGVSYMSELECIQDKTHREFLLNNHNSNMDRELHILTYRSMQDRLSDEPVGLIDEEIGNDIILNVWVSFAEIYNESIYDLLKPEPYKCKLRKKLHLGHVNGTAYIKGLTSISVSSGMEAYLILQYGLHNLNYAATSINSHSSRSHCIFTLKIAQASSRSEEEYVSVFNFCDLAGSERIKKTNNVGDRLKESNSINRSLLVLGRCIKIIRNNQKYKTNKIIPFRESKLTQLFQNALLGHEAVSMIVNINSSREMFDETQHVLLFSAIAKDVVVEQQVLKSCRNTRFSDLLKRNVSISGNVKDAKELQEQVLILTETLQQKRLECKEDQARFIGSYKEILENTNKYWEKRKEDLLCELEQVLKDCPEKKKRKLSVVVLSSSSDEELEECDREEERLRIEIDDLKLKLNNQKDKILKATEKYSSLEDSLTNWKRSVLELKLKSESTINKMNSEIIINNEKIKELQEYAKLINTGENVTKTSGEESDKENCSRFENLDGKREFNETFCLSN